VPAHQQQRTPDPCDGRPSTVTTGDRPPRTSGGRSGNVILAVKQGSLGPVGRQLSAVGSILVVGLPRELSGQPIDDQLVYRIEQVDLAFGVRGHRDGCPQVRADEGVLPVAAVHPVYPGLVDPDAKPVSVGEPLAFGDGAGVDAFDGHPSQVGRREELVCVPLAVLQQQLREAGEFVGTQEEVAFGECESAWTRVPGRVVEIQRRKQAGVGDRNARPRRWPAR
jgi:hypothetical protein